MPSGALPLLCQSEHIESDDIERFWQAHHHLAKAAAPSDSIAFREAMYLKRAGKGFRKFQRVRTLRAETYVYTLSAHSAYCTAGRENTVNAGSHPTGIASIMAAFEGQIKRFKDPACPWP